MANHYEVDINSKASRLAVKLKKSPAYYHRPAVEYFKSRGLGTKAERTLSLRDKARRSREVARVCREKPGTVVL